MVFPGAVHCLFLSDFSILVRVFSISPLAIFLALMLAGASALAADRAALLIGNQSYAWAPLLTPVNDVRAMGGALRAAGFEVEVLENASQTDFYEQVERFVHTHEKASVQLFFYAGHAIQMNGRNYLIPVEAKLDDPDILSRLFDLRHLLERLKNTQATTRLVILDACRNNPFSRNPNASNGLSELTAPSNTLVAFSTAPGSTADDGEGSNSPYTTGLLSALFWPGMQIEDAFKTVRRQVRQGTGGAQVPWESTSLEHDFIMVNPRPAPAPRGKNGKQQTALAPNPQTPPGKRSAPSSSKSDCARIFSKLSLGLNPLTPLESAQLPSCR